MALTTVKEQVLRELVAAGNLSSATAIGRSGGFCLRVTFGTSERLLGSTRGSVRMFASLTTLATRLQEFGITKFGVDVSEYKPGRVRPARPDRAEALRRTRSKPRQSELLGANDD